MADAEQLEGRRQPVLMVERDDGELHRRHEFAALRLGRSVEPGAEGRVEPEQLEIEQLADQVESGLELQEALANQALLLCRERDLGRRRARGGRRFEVLATGAWMAADMARLLPARHSGPSMRGQPLRNR